MSRVSPYHHPNPDLEILNTISFPLSPLFGWRRANPDILPPSLAKPLLDFFHRDSALASGIIGDFPSLAKPLLDFPSLAKRG